MFKDNFNQCTHDSFFDLQIYFGSVKIIEVKRYDLFIEFRNLWNDRHDERSVLLLFRGRIASALQLLEIVTLLKITKVFELFDLVEVEVEMCQLFASTNFLDLPNQVIRKVKCLQGRAVLKKFEIGKFVEG